MTSLTISHEQWFKSINELNRSEINRALNEGFNPYARNHQGQSALQILLKTDDDKNNETILDLIKMLLDKGVDPSEIDRKDGTFPLHRAIQKKNFKLIKLLLDKRADPNVKTKQGISALQLAYQSDSPKTLIELLLKHSVDINEVFGEDNRTILISAIQNNKYDISAMALEARADPNVKTKKGISPLQLAYQSDSPKNCIELLLKHRADINEVFGENDETILIRALQNNRYDLSEMALKARANPNVKTKKGISPLQLAYRSDSPKAFMELLLEYRVDINEVFGENDETILIRALQNNRYDIAKIALEADADPNVKTKKGVSPLQLAYYSDSPKAFIELLLEYQVDINEVFGENDETILIGALQNNRYDIAKIALEADADPNVKTKKGVSPLQLAYYSDSPKAFIDLLLEYNADVNEVFGKNDETILIGALKNNRYDIAQAVLEVNADPNLKTKKGVSPLQLAYSSNSPKAFIDLLLEYDADVNEIFGENNETLLISALRGSNYAIAKSLLDNGADPNLKAKNGLSPMQLAHQSDSSNAFVALLSEYGAHEKLEPAKGDSVPTEVSSKVSSITHQSSSKSNPPRFDILSDSSIINAKELSLWVDQIKNEIWHEINVNDAYSKYLKEMNRVLCWLDSPGFVQNLNHIVIETSHDDVKEVEDLDSMEKAALAKENTLQEGLGETAPKKIENVSARPRRVIGRLNETSTQPQGLSDKEAVPPSKEVASRWFTLEDRERERILEVCHLILKQEKMQYDIEEQKETVSSRQKLEQSLNGFFSQYSWGQAPKKAAQAVKIPSISWEDGTSSLDPEKISEVHAQVWNAGRIEVPVNEDLRWVSINTPEGYAQEGWLDTLKESEEKFGKDHESHELWVLLGRKNERIASLWVYSQTMVSLKVNDPQNNEAVMMHMDELLKKTHPNRQLYAHHQYKMPLPDELTYFKGIGTISPYAPLVESDIYDIFGTLEHEKNLENHRQELIRAIVKTDRWALLPVVMSISPLENLGKAFFKKLKTIEKTKSAKHAADLDLLLSHNSDTLWKGLDFKIKKGSFAALFSVESDKKQAIYSLLDWYIILEAALKKNEDTVALWALQHFYHFNKELDDYEQTLKPESRREKMVERVIAPTWKHLMQNSVHIANTFMWNEIKHYARMVDQEKNIKENLNGTVHDSKWNGTHASLSDLTTQTFIKSYEVALSLGMDEKVLSLMDDSPLEKPLAIEGLNQEDRLKLMSYAKDAKNKAWQSWAIEFIVPEITLDESWWKKLPYLQKENQTPEEEDTYISGIVSKMGSKTISSLLVDMNQMSFLLKADAPNAARNKKIYLALEKTLSPSVLEKTALDRLLTLSQLAVSYQWKGKSDQDDLLRHALEQVKMAAAKGIKSQRKESLVEWMKVTSNPGFPHTIEKEVESLILEAHDAKKHAVLAMDLIRKDSEVQSVWKQRIEVWLHDENIDLEDIKQKLIQKTHWSPRPQSVRKRNLYKVG